MLMNNPDIVIDESVLRAYSSVVSVAKLKRDKDETSNITVLNDIIITMQQFDYAQYEICDMLIKDMFKEHNVFKNDRRKEFFFAVYGDIVYENILANKLKYGYACVDCGAEIKKVNGKCRCAECQGKRNTMLAMLRKRKQRSMSRTENI